MFIERCQPYADNLRKDPELTVILRPASFDIHSQRWRVVWYDDAPSEQLLTGAMGMIGEAVEYLEGKVPDDFYRSLEEKVEWLRGNVMYVRGWGVVSGRDAQRGSDKVEVQVPPKLRFGEALPEGAKVTRRKR